MISACNIEDVPSYGGSAFSDIVGGTNASYTGFSQIGGSKKRRRTKRKRGKRTKHCRCKICKCKKCRCDKKHSKIGGDDYGTRTDRLSEALRLIEESEYRGYNNPKTAYQDPSDKAYDDAMEQAMNLRNEGKIREIRDTDIMEYVKKISDKETPKRRSSSRSSSRSSTPRRSRNSSRIRSLLKNRSYPRNRNPTRNRFTTRNRIPPRTARPPTQSTKPSGYVKELKEVEPEGKDYKLTGKKFNLIETGGGGDCFFHTIAYLVLGDKNKHYEVRSSMVDWVDNNREKEIINKSIGDLPITDLMTFQGGGSRKRGKAKYGTREEQNRIIDNYCRTMGTKGTWAEGKLEYYFMCKALFHNYGKKIKMILYNFPCIPDPTVKSGKRCLRDIKQGYREDFCTMLRQDPIHTLFKDNERGLVTIHVMNKNQGHFQALVESS